ncbi:hypothetical protein C8R44DRAFT_889885 [Mycena epipterygia]|nr:hypothetical protein C8R44DRAFT_889885 [Mycena epipterygia]
MSLSPPLEEYTGRHRRYDSFYYQNDWLDGPQFQEGSGPTRFPEWWPHIVRESEYEEHHLRQAFCKKYRPHSDGRVTLSDAFLRDGRQLEGHLAVCDATAILCERVMTEAKILEDAIRELLDLNFFEAWLGIKTWSIESIPEPSYEHPPLIPSSTWSWGPGIWDTHRWAAPAWADQDPQPSKWWPTAPIPATPPQNGAIWRHTTGELWRNASWCTGVDSGDPPTPHYNPYTVCLPHWKELWPCHMRVPRQSDRLRSRCRNISRIACEYSQARHIRRAKIRDQYKRLRREVASRCTSPQID